MCIKEWLKKNYQEKCHLKSIKWYLNISHFMNLEIKKMKMFENRKYDYFE